MGYQLHGTHRLSARRCGGWDGGGWDGGGWGAPAAAARACCVRACVCRARRRGRSWAARDGVRGRMCERHVRASAWRGRGRGSVVRIAPGRAYTQERCVRREAVPCERVMLMVVVSAGQGAELRVCAERYKSKCRPACTQNVSHPVRVTRKLVRRFVLRRSMLLVHMYIMISTSYRMRAMWRVTRRVVWHTGAFARGSE